jgi:thimet oligopeptidase
MGTPYRSIEAANGPLSFKLSAADVKKICSESMNKADKRFAALGALKGQSNFDNSIGAFEEIGADLSEETNIAMFLKDVSTEKEIRDAAQECEELVSKFAVDLYSRADLYAVLNAFSKSDEAKKLEGERKKLLEETLLDFRRGGMELPEEKRAELVKARKRLAELEIQFARNVNESRKTVEFDRAELAGLPEPIVQRLEKTKDEKFKVSTDYPDYFPFMQEVKDGEARRKLQFVFETRAAKENLPLIKEAIALREKAATLLGYATHADYVLEKQMAKNPTRVNEFLKNLRTRLRPYLEADLQKMLDLKRKEDPKATVINNWDWRFYENVRRKTEFDLDQQAVKEYFPLDVVLNGMFDIYQTILGLQFKEVKSPDVWHQDVRLFEVFEKNGKSKKPISYFYIDLFPRENKYEHAAKFTLVSGRLQKSGTYQKPVVAIVANFDKPTKDRPSLLPHSDVETLFHEFGHVVHSLVTKAEFSSFAGTSVDRDFVEAPSQMLENWVWDGEMLKKMSGHYKDHSKKLPEEMRKKLIAAKNLNNGVKYSRQLMFGLVDMEYHTSKKPVDTTAVWEKVQNEVMKIPFTKGTYPETGFGHLMGGYDSGYYGYLWSEVFAADMFTRFEKEGLLNAKTGADYRTWILEPGGSLEPDVLLKGFLRREPNMDAFFKSIGLNETK